MRVGVILEQALHSGGGFQQSLNAIEQLYRIRPEWLSISLFTTVEANVQHPAMAGKELHYIRRGRAENILCAALSQTDSIILNRALARMRVVTRLERLLIENNIDLAYFLAPSGYAPAFRKIPYLFTVWDLCHRDHPEFPEVGAYGEFMGRENLYRNSINRSFLTLTDSEELSCRVRQNYGVDQERLLIMPFQPARFAGTAADNNQFSMIDRLALPKDYLFYPAQFWPHKNHARILQALAVLKGKALFYNAVFCGGDKGNKGYIQKMARDLDIEEQVFFTGFVPESEMKGLYKNCRALVMPTYFGPTNLPPLEAWALGKPVIYSTSLAAQVGDAAICVDPDSVEELVEAIRSIYVDDSQVAVMAARGLQQLKLVEELRMRAEITLVEKLKSFRNRRLCWGEMQ